MKPLLFEFVRRALVVAPDASQIPDRCLPNSRQNLEEGLGRQDDPSYRGFGHGVVVLLAVGKKATRCLARRLKWEISGSRTDAGQTSKGNGPAARALRELRSRKRGEGSRPKKFSIGTALVEP